MLDLGGTLESNGETLPFVPECLEVLQQFICEDHSLIEWCLVSDYHLAKPFSSEGVSDHFSQYLETLEQLQLTEFFKPAESRITLSTHAKVYKPERQVFE
jgi:hypothetical protein